MNATPPGAVSPVKTRLLLAIIAGASTYQEVFEATGLHLWQVRDSVRWLAAHGLVTYDRKGRWVHNLRPTVGAVR